MNNYQNTENIAFATGIVLFIFSFLILKVLSFSSMKGEDVLERSSELIHSGDVIKTSNGSSQVSVMFLFDHQLVYCKKVRNRGKGSVFEILWRTFSCKH